jgi:hypothetical protein
MYMVYICTKCYMFTYQGSLLTTMKPKERKKGKILYKANLLLSRIITNKIRKDFNMFRRCMTVH